MEPEFKRMSPGAAAAFSLMTRLTLLAVVGGVLLSLLLLYTLHWMSG